MSTDNQNTPTEQNQPNTPQAHQAQPEPTKEAPQNYLEELAQLREQFEAAQKSKEAPEPEPTTEEPKDAPTPEVKPEDYDSPLDFTIALVGKATGVTEDKLVTALGNALSYNDEKLIDFNSLTQGLKPDDAEQVKYLAKAMYKEATAKTADIQKQAYELAGSKEQWEQSVTAFNSKAGKAEQVQAKALADAGYVKESVALVVKTVRDLGLVSHVEKPALKGSGQPSPTKALTAQEFRAGTQALFKEYGANYLSNREARAKYDALSQQFKPNQG